MYSVEELQSWTNIQKKSRKLHEMSAIVRLQYAFRLSLGRQQISR